MKRKHLKSVFVLAAAVALGTLNPVVLPYTSVVARAEDTITTITDDTLTDVKFGLFVGNKVRIYSDGPGADLNTAFHNKQFVYGFGSTSAAAIKDAVENEKKVVIEPDKAAFVDLPKRTDTTSDISLVILTKDGAVAGNAVGKELILKADNTKPNVDIPEKDVAEITVNTQGLEYRETPVELSDIDAGWIEVPSNNKVTAPSIEAGTQKIIYFRKKAKEHTLASSATAITYTKTKKITLEDLRALSYEVGNGGIQISLAQSTITDVVTKSGIASYVVVNTAKLEPNTLEEGDFSNETDLGAGIDFSDIPVSDGQSVIVYVKDDGNKKTQFIAINVKRETKPELKQDGNKYRLVGSGTYKLKEGKAYQYRLNTAYRWAEAMPKKEGDTLYLEVPDKGEYLVRTKLDGGKINIVDNKADVNLGSEQSEVINVAVNNKLIGIEDFSKLKFKTVSDSGLKIVISDIDQVLKPETTDAIKYSINGNERRIDNVTSSGAIATTDAINAGDVFTIETVDNSSLRKTIRFLGIADKDGKHFAPKYQSPKAIKEAMGDVGNYKIKKVGDIAEARQATGDVYTETGKYELSYNMPTDGNAINFDPNTNECKYLLAGTVEVFLQTEADAAKENNSFSVYPSVPSGGDGSIAPKKDEVKKDEPKKDEPKTDGTKKADDTTDTQVTGSNTETKVTVRNTKRADVKVSAKKIEKALETGLKVANKSGEVTFTSEAVKKIVGDEAKAVTVTLKAAATKISDLKVTKQVKRSNLASKAVFILKIKSGNKNLKDRDVKDSKMKVALRVSLGYKNKNLYVVDLSSGKKVKAKYNSKTKKVSFTTSSVGEFVLTNK